MRLARKAALGVLSRLYKHPSAIPNGLKGSLRSFSDVGDICYELNGVLLREDVSLELGVWKRFTSRYPARMCVSGEIGSILREADLCRPRSLGLSALVGLLEQPKVDPADAEILGRLWLLTKEERDWQSNDLRESLNGLLFRSEADKWTEARALLAADGPLDSNDEPRRHKLAPPECRLHPDYYTEKDDKWPAVAFFLACRPRMEAPAEMLAKWVLAARSADARLAALCYLANGELGERVAERVRGQDWLRTALNDLHLAEELTEEQQDRLRRRLLSQESIRQAMPNDDSGGYSPPIMSPPPVDLTTALERIYEWWSNEGHERAEEYRNRLYPQDIRSLDLKGNPKSDPGARSSWFTLLALGSFQGMGRTRDEQHRKFIQHCQARGWWDTFTNSDPEQEPERWMDIIEEYAEAQHDDEEWMQWLGQFPKLYKLRRWLDDYVELFRSMDQFEEPFNLDMILAPRSTSHFQGGGIDAPPLTRTLNVGAHFVVRELLHRGVIRNPLSIPHAYAPIARIRDFFEAFDVYPPTTSPPTTSEDIHRLLTEHLGEEQAAFCGNYDIPLRIVTSDASLHKQLLNGLGS